MKKCQITPISIPAKINNEYFKTKPSKRKRHEILSSAGNKPEKSKLFTSFLSKNLCLLFPSHFSNIFTP